MWLIALILVLCSSCGGPEGGWLEQEQKVCPKGDVSSGIDVSHWDDTIDWASVAASGVRFTVIKATEKSDFIDPAFATNWAGSKQHGIIRGAYHFFRAAVDPIAQADHFLKVLGSSQLGDLPPTLDLESTDGLSGQVASQRALQFLDRVATKTGRTPIVYTSVRVFSQELNNPAGFGPYTLWVSSRLVNCPDIPAPPWSDWAFWQHTSKGTVPGISSQVDLNKFNGSLTELQSFASGGAMDGGVDALVGGVDSAVVGAVGDAAVGADAAGEPVPQEGCQIAPGGRPPGRGMLVLLLGLAAAFRLRRRATVQ